jgi:Prolyl oligopeptidase, N-terminal beta-propeller domain
MKKLDRALEFPATRRDPDSGFTLHGRRYDDPYAWLERLDDAETQAWIEAQEAVTHAVLRAVPGRDWLPERPASRRAPARASEWLRRLQHLGAADLYGGQRRSAEAGRRARLPQHPRRRRIRPRLARGGSQDAAAKRLRRLHRRGALARLGGLHDALKARLPRQQQRRAELCCWALDVAPPLPGEASGATSDDAQPNPGVPGQ